ncbi:hypothetical protein A9Q84_02140 [Halobacteriovorax marinus]|uniref:Rhodanese domain-containing protein n=1 Tax=Halobacteriovorax marinus TaxID=97084 RepID=A0A1Y5FCU5_9BACT|nr:hypothetical protein A9Q84_02140 [Halobacteriovorax marinus]
MKTILIMISLVLLQSCFAPSKAQNKLQIVKSMGESTAKQFPTVKHLSIEDFEKLEASKYVLVDVRSAPERRVSMLPNAISKSEFEENPSKYQNKTIVTYCTIGYRSSKYAIKLQDKGLKVFSLKESILGWAVREKPLYIEGKETRKVHIYSDAWNFLPEGYTGVYK